MTLRADHLAGAFFIAFGVLILALSGDLPMGGLSMPGAGFLPKILAGLTICVRSRADRAGGGKPAPRRDRVGRRQARGAVTAITAAAIALFEHGSASSSPWC